MNGTPAGKLSVGHGRTRPPSFSGHVNWSTKRIWCLGDSITWGTGDGPGEAIGCGYRDVLANLLRANGHEGVQFIGSQANSYNCNTCPHNFQIMNNDGHAGFTCPMIQAAMGGYFSACAPVDAIFLHIGTNDLINFGNPTAINNFNALLPAVVALQPNAIFLVCTLVPSLIGGLAAFNTNVTAQIALQVAAGVRMYEVDQGAALVPAPSGDFTTGNVHPNTQGYSKMAAAFYSEMIAVPVV